METLLVIIAVILILIAYELWQIISLLKLRNKSEDNIRAVEKWNPPAFENEDKLLQKAYEIVKSEGTSSASLLQRKMRIGYARAARLLHLLREKNLVDNPKDEKSQKIVLSSYKNDLLYDDVLVYIRKEKTVSVSMIHRKFDIGYARAARILDQLEQEGHVGPEQRSLKREVLK